MSPHIIKATSGVNGHQQTQTDTPRHPWTMSGWKTHNFGTTQEGGNFFHLDPLGHQNIKTSLHFLPKNHRPFVAIFSSVREKLQLTVSLNHPVFAYFVLHLLQSNLGFNGFSVFQDDPYCDHGRVLLCYGHHWELHERADLQKVNIASFRKDTFVTPHCHSHN